MIYLLLNSSSPLYIQGPSQQKPSKELEVRFFLSHSAAMSFLSHNCTRYFYAVYIYTLGRWRRAGIMYNLSFIFPYYILPRSEANTDSEPSEELEVDVPSSFMFSLLLSFVHTHTHTDTKQWLSVKSRGTAHVYIYRHINLIFFLHCTVLSALSFPKACTLSLLFLPMQ